MGTKRAQICHREGLAAEEGHRLLVEVNRIWNGEDTLSHCSHPLPGLSQHSSTVGDSRLWTRWTSRFFSMSSPKLNPQTIGATETQGHFPSLSTNICGAAPTCPVLALLLPSSGLPRGGARAQEVAGTTSNKPAIKSNNKTFWKDTKQVKQGHVLRLPQGTPDTKYSRARKVLSSDLVTELGMRN